MYLPPLTMGMIRALANTVNYNELPDEQVALLARKGDQKAMEYIVGKYTNFVKMRSGPYFLAGAEREDLVQEGLIGLYKAIKSFDGERCASFKTFAEVCVVRQMITAVKSSTRKKNSPLNHYISIHDSSRDSEETGFFPALEDMRNMNPESIMIEKETAQGMESEIGRLLSGFENQVLALYLQGVPYKEIALQLERTPKAVDNALTRIKKKIEHYIVGES